MNFNKDRFANFAKYDLTINKAFFRNMVFVTIAGVVGIAMLGFMMRYNIYHETADNVAEWGVPPVPGDFSHYTWNFITTLYEVGFITLMLAIFAGCWAHNLRNKQGRITELTLPVTNLEKFIWHALITLVGGFALCIISLLVADGLNALLTLMVFGADNGVGSLTASAWQLLTFTTYDRNFLSLPMISVNGSTDPIDESEVRMLYATTFLIISSVICETLIFFFGNALKYKYNIILTYIALQVLGTIGTIGFFIFTAVAADQAIENFNDWDVNGDDMANLITGSLIALGILALILSVLLVWWSYSRYTKAQITTSLNK